MVTKSSFFIKALLCVVSSAVLLACTRKGAQTSDIDGVLPTDKLVVLLADLHEADGVMVVSGMQPPRLDSIGTLAYNKIFKDNACTPGQMETSLAYYHAVPDTMDGIYRRVIEVLNQRITHAENDKRKDDASKRAGAIQQIKPKQGR